MIRENQKLLNQINVLTDAAILFVSLPLSFFIRFYVLPDGIATVPLSDYLLLDGLLMLTHLLSYASLGLYASFRRASLPDELLRLWFAGVLNITGLLSILFLVWEVDYSRLTLALYFLLSVTCVSCKRILLRLYLRRLRRAGYNQKHVVILGMGKTAFTRGLARGLGCTDMVTSPTYTIVNEYLSGRLPLFHFDMYRLESADDLWDIGWEDYLQRGGVCAVEWSENVSEAMTDAVVVCIEKISDTCRRITVEGVESLADLSL